MVLVTLSKVLWVLMHNKKAVCLCFRQGTFRRQPNPLLIDETEVTAGHAASIGQVDPEDMYYLMSRGLDQDTAERLVIRGFLGSSY